MTMALASSFEAGASPPSASPIEALFADLAGVRDAAISRGRSYLGGAFTLKRWFEEVHSAGIIPVSLILWQLTGNGVEPGHEEAAP